MFFSWVFFLVLFIFTGAAARNRQLAPKHFFELHGPGLEEPSLASVMEELPALSSLMEPLGSRSVPDKRPGCQPICCVWLPLNWLRFEL